MADLRTAQFDANERIRKLEETNGALCAEINRQEKRIRQLEQLVRDMRRVFWKCYRPYVSCFPDNCRDCVHYAHWCSAKGDFDKRMAELGIEV